MRTMVWTVGCTGAGKTTVARATFPAFVRIDPDELMEALPGYTPERCVEFHAEGRRLANAMFDDALARGGEYVIDGTGANSDRMAAQMTRARAAGFRVVVLYVSTPLNVCLQRNALRARRVPDHVVHEKYEQVRFAFDRVAPLADEVIVRSG